MVHTDGSNEELPTTGGIALGVMPNLEYREASVTLAPGDTLILYTDGVSEAMNSEGEEFGVDRLMRIFNERAPASAKEANEVILQAVVEFADGYPQSDDVTCLVLRRVGG